MPYVTIDTKVKKIVRRGAPGPPGGAVVQRGIIRLDDHFDTIITLAETFYPVLGSFVDGENLGFTLDTNGVITHTGSSGVFLMNGVSNVSTNKACHLTYATYVDGVLVDRSQSTIDIPSSAKTGFVGITDVIRINNGQTLQVYIKADTTAVVASLETLKVTFWGGY